MHCLFVPLYQLMGPKHFLMGMGWRQHSTAAPSLIPTVNKKISEEKIVDVAKLLRLINGAA